MFLKEKVRKDSEPTFARIICAKLKCGGNAQIFAVALQQQEVLNPLIKRKKTERILNLYLRALFALNRNAAIARK